MSFPPRAVAFAAAALLAIGAACLYFDRNFWGHPPVVGSVDQFKDTEIVAHPDVPLDPTKNVIWCGAIDLGWNALMDYRHGPINLDPPNPLAALLNKKEFNSGDLDTESFLVASGRTADGVETKFREQLRRKFGADVNPPALEDPVQAAANDDISVFAYLSKSLLFADPFNVNLPLSFEGNKVANFGFGYEKYPSTDAPMNLAKEVRVLRYISDDDFIIELKTKSAGDQLVLAKIPPKKTLAETINSVLPAIKPSDYWGVGNDDKLAIPKIDFNLIVRFKGLEHQNFPGGRLNTVAENVVFRLNEKGVELTGWAGITALLDAVQGAKPMHLVFDKPFLVLLKRASSPRPYFAMWVGNATLLVSP